MSSTFHSQLAETSSLHSLSNVKAITTVPEPGRHLEVRNVPILRIFYLSQFRSLPFMALIYVNNYGL